jgi:hypothetical protein
MVAATHWPAYPGEKNPQYPLHRGYVVPGAGVAVVVYGVDLNIRKYIPDQASGSDIIRENIQSGRWWCILNMV